MPTHGKQPAPRRAHWTRWQLSVLLAAAPGDQLYRDAQTTIAVRPLSFPPANVSQEKLSCSVLPTPTVLQRKYLTMYYTYKHWLGTVYTCLLSIFLFLNCSLLPDDIIYTAVSIITAPFSATSMPLLLRRNSTGNSFTHTGWLAEASLSVSVTTIKWSRRN